jgi:glycosyltransferase involved in cell wall biosynthesis
MPPRRKYVVAFNRDRDFYQLPLALAEEDALQRLVTDLYVPDYLARTRLPSLLGVAHRRTNGLRSKLVECSTAALLLQMIDLKRAGTEKEKSLVFRRLDSALSRRAGQIAVKEGSGAFLYSGYALEAFEMLHAGDHGKLLFVYHPQGDYVRCILEEDFARYPQVAMSHRRHLDEIAVNEGDRVAQEIEMADAIACASSFTARSVAATLSNPKPVAVIPYGAACATEAGAVTRAGKRPRVLFVGQGTQRKGLHHLLEAWRSGVHGSADLTLVLNQSDPGILRMLELLPAAPRVLSSLSRAELNREFESADVFVLPSLVEGFGLVYLEALAAGCHVIGTQNTGLPDLAAPEEAATVVPAGDLDRLRSALETAIGKAAAGGHDREAIRAFAASRKWENFRAGIRSFVDQAEQSKVVGITALEKRL